MSCDCYKIGGPFIAEDPDCPAHGTEAKERERREANDRANRERAAMHLVEILTPAAALGVDCPLTTCGRRAGAPCRENRYGDVPSHAERCEAARSELHTLFLALGLGA